QVARFLASGVRESAWMGPSALGEPGVGSDQEVGAEEASAEETNGAQSCP
ncbi:MAG: hypothetical protein ACI80K_003807, partial [Paracoccaceae bacterium]